MNELIGQQKAVNVDERQISPSGASAGLSRREFITTTVAAGIALCAAPQA